MVEFFGRVRVCGKVAGVRADTKERPRRPVWPVPIPKPPRRIHRGSDLVSNLDGDGCHLAVNVLDGGNGDIITPARHYAVGAVAVR